MIKIDIKRLKQEIARLDELNRFHKKRLRISRSKLGDIYYMWCSADIDRAVKDGRSDVVYWNSKERSYTHIDPNKQDINLEFRESCREWYKLSLRATKLCTLRALIRNKIHFSPNSVLYLHYGLSKIDRDSLLEWVSAEIEEFAIAVSD